MTTPSSSPSTLSSTNVSSSTELSPDESMPAVNPDETTILPVTQVSNETDESIASAESSTDENLSRLNETSTVSYQTSSVPSLEGVDYKSSEAT